MGRRSAAETIAGVFQCFLERSTWTQTELADALGLTTKALRVRLDELRREGLPLEREGDGGPRVTWRMREGWFPGSVQWPAREVAALLRVLVQAPQSVARDQLIERVVGVVPRSRVPARTRDVIDGPARSTTEAQHMDSSWR